MRCGPDKLLNRYQCPGWNFFLCSITILIQCNSLRAWRQLELCVNRNAPSAPKIPRKTAGHPITREQPLLVSFSWAKIDLNNRVPCHCYGLLKSSAFQCILRFVKGILFHQSLSPIISVRFCTLIIVLSEAFYWYVCYKNCKDWFKICLQFSDYWLQQRLHFFVAW